MSTNYFEPLDALTIQELVGMVSTFSVITDDLMEYILSRYKQYIEEENIKLVERGNKHG